MTFVRHLRGVGLGSGTESLVRASTNLLSVTGLDKHDPLRTTCHNKNDREIKITTVKTLHNDYPRYRIN